MYFGSSKLLLIKSIKELDQHDIEGTGNETNLLFGYVFVTILQICSPKVTLIRNHILSMLVNTIFETRCVLPLTKFSRIKSDQVNMLIFQWAVSWITFIRIFLF